MKKKSKPKKGLRLILYMTFWGILVFSFGVGTVVTLVKHKEYNLELATVQQQIQEEQQRAAALENEKDYYKSDMFVAKIAEEQLGLMRPDETLYYSVAE